MKKKLFLISLLSAMLVIGLIAIACSKGEGSPSDVVKQFYAAVEKGDVKTALELVTYSSPEKEKEFKDLLSLMPGIIAMIGGIVNTEESINANTAVVRVTSKDGGTDRWDLVKIGGKWKIKH